MGGYLRFPWIRDQNIHRVTTLNHSPSSRPSAAVAWELPSSGLPGAWEKILQSTTPIHSRNLTLISTIVMFEWSYMELPFPKHHFGALQPLVFGVCNKLGSIFGSHIDLWHGNCLSKGVTNMKQTKWLKVKQWYIYNYKVKNPDKRKNYVKNLPQGQTMTQGQESWSNTHNWLEVC